MEDWEEIERFRSLIMEMEPPRHSLSLFGVKCPFCGKSDRIRKLESPGEANGAPAEYERLWARFGTGGELAVCKFCHHLLRLFPRERRIVALGSEVQE
jgi:hypothetical protein